MFCPYHCLFYYLYHHYLVLPWTDQYAWYYYDNIHDHCLPMNLMISHMSVFIHLYIYTIDYIPLQRGIFTLSSLVYVIGISFSLNNTTISQYSRYLKYQWGDGYINSHNGEISPFYYSSLYQSFIASLCMIIFFIYLL